MKKLNNLLGFTLVELIVVITIVWILSTVGFVSYSGYLTWARDSNRISQLTKLSDSLQVYAANKTLPLPDNYVEITESWSILAYQWEVWVDVLETIDYTNWGKDPRDDSYYTYYLTKDRNNLQLMAFMEEQQSVLSFIWNQALAIDYTDSFPRTYGKDLWILIEPITNTPIQDSSSVVNALDIKNTFEEYVMHVNSSSYTWTGSRLINLHYYYNLDRNDFIAEDEVPGWFVWGVTWIEFLIAACNDNRWKYIVVDAKDVIENSGSNLYFQESWLPLTTMLYNWEYSWRLVLNCNWTTSFGLVLEDWEEPQVSGAS